MNTLQSGSSWRTSMASLEATPQHTLEQYSLPMWRSRLPTHWTKQIALGRQRRWTGRTTLCVLQHRLEVLQGDDVGVLVVPVELRLPARVEVLEPGGHDDRPRTR